MTSQCITEPCVDETKFVSAARPDVFAVINGGANQRAVPDCQGVTIHSICYILTLVKIYKETIPHRRGNQRFPGNGCGLYYWQLPYNSFCTLYQTSHIFYLNDYTEHSRKQTPLCSMSSVSSE